MTPCNRFSKILCRDTYLCRDEPDVLAIAEELDRAEERSATPFELEAAAVAHFHALLQAGRETWH
jgi:hypothetical protein